MANDVAVLVQWLSPAFPISAYAYSHGLEAAVAAGDVSDADDLQAWVAQVLAYGAGSSDVTVMTAAFNGDWQAAELQARALAASAERLSETQTQGAAFAQLLRSVWDLQIEDGCYPVVLGRAAKMRGLDLPLTATLYLQAFASNLLQAAQRLAPIGQTQAQQVLSDLMGDIPGIVDAGLVRGLDDISNTAFLSDIHAMQHETLSPRIFRT